LGSALGDFQMRSPALGAREQREQNILKLSNMGFRDAERCMEALQVSDDQLLPAITLLLTWAKEDGRKNQTLKESYRELDALEQLKALRAMGFVDVRANFEALQATKGNFERAVHKLIEDRKREDSLLRAAHQNVDAIRVSEGRESKTLRQSQLCRQRERERFRRQEEREARIKTMREELKRNLTRQLHALETQKAAAKAALNFSLTNELTMQIHMLKHRLDPKRFDQNAHAALLAQEIETVMQHEMEKRLLQTIMASLGTRLPKRIPLISLPMTLRPIAKSLVISPGLLSYPEQFYEIMNKALVAATAINSAYSNSTKEREPVAETWLEDEEIKGSFESARLAVVESFTHTRASSYSLARREVEDGRIARRVKRQQEKELEEMQKAKSDRGLSFERNIVNLIEEELLQLRPMDAGAFSEKLRHLTNTSAGLIPSNVALEGNWEHQTERNRGVEASRKKKVHIYQRKRELRQRKLLRERQVEALRGYLNSKPLGEVHIRPPPFDVKKPDGTSTTLIEGVTLRLTYGRRYGLVSRNGMGKTTLMHLLADYQVDGFPNHLRVLLVEQELVPSRTKTVLERVLQADFEREVLMKEELRLLSLLSKEGEVEPNTDQESDSEEDGNGATIDLWKEEGKDISLEEKLTRVHDRMADIDVDQAEARASKILSGLGFTAEMQNKPTSTLSGGWLMRVAIARGLFVRPDLLLLDEPTNHLDIPSILWLQDYLVNYPATVVVVSHDRDFLNRVATDILHIEDRRLFSYKGNYDAFIKSAPKEILS